MEDNLNPFMLLFLTKFKYYNRYYSAPFFCYIAVNIYERKSFDIKSHQLKIPGDTAGYFGISYRLYDRKLYDYGRNTETKALLIDRLGVLHHSEVYRGNQTIIISRHLENEKKLLFN